MNKIMNLLLAIISMIIIVVSCQASKSSVTYEKYCTTCHGTDASGGNSETLFDSEWQFGSDARSIENNIRYGIDNYGMPAFEEKLEDEEIDELVEFILGGEYKSDSEKETVDVFETFDYVVNVETVADNLDEPWAIEFLSDDKILVTEKPGRLRIIENGILLNDDVAGIPEVEFEGQGGLLDVAIDPEYDENGWIYLSFSHLIGEDAMTKIVRGKLDGLNWTEEQVLFEADRDLYIDTRHHYGSRIVFDKNGYLYFSIGDRGEREDAQILSKPNGKIHRINRDGSIPQDNPVLSNKNAIPSIYAYGSRNSQGLVFHPVTDELWSTEHGQKGGDELNIIRPGNNYGWDVITYGRNYDGTVSTEKVEMEGMEYPILFWRPSIAVCGLDFYNGDLFPKWKGHLLVGALKYEEVRLLDIVDERVIHQETLVKNLGRVRDVCAGPDGAIYVAVNEPGKILRLTPEE
jgi:glucose/arabinose dehydrogenase